MPYSYVINNPLKYTDPTGNEIDGGASWRAQQAAQAAAYQNHMYEYTSWTTFLNSEKRDFFHDVMGPSGGGQTIGEVNMGEVLASLESATSKESCLDFQEAMWMQGKIGKEPEIKVQSGGGDYLQYEAKFVNAYKTQGNLIWYNSSGEVVATYPAVSGASNIKSYTIPEGTWNASYLNPKSHPKYSLNGVSFRVTLGPDRYDPLRGRETDLIRIHPARSPGTEGCIGLRGDKANLLDFYNRYSNYNSKYGEIPIHVIYSKPK